MANLGTDRHRSQSILSHRTNSTWRGDVFGQRQPRGAMVFSGPDSLRMHRQRVLDPTYVGETSHPNRELSASSMYLWRAAPGTPHPRPKSSFSDAYGWGTWGDMAELCSWKHLNRSHPIRLGTFRQMLEQQSTHANQAAWYAGKDAGQRYSSLPHTSKSSENNSLKSESRVNSSERLLSARQQERSPTLGTEQESTTVTN